jgi:hypothetical protein
MYMACVLQRENSRMTAQNRTFASDAMRPLVGLAISA